MELVTGISVAMKGRRPTKTLKRKKSQIRGTLQEREKYEQVDTIVAS